MTEASEEMSFTQWRTHLTSLLDYALSQQQQSSSNNTGRTPARGSTSNKLAELFPKYLKLDTTISSPTSVSNESSNIEMKDSNSASFSQAVFTVSVSHPWPVMTVCLFFFVVKNCVFISARL